MTSELAFFLSICLFLLSPLAVRIKTHIVLQPLRSRTLRSARAITHAQLGRFGARR